MATRPRRNFLLLTLLLCISFPSFSQTSIGGTINTYTDITALGACANKVTVSNSAGFSVGDAVIIIQMKGAVMDETNTASFGTISSYNSTGLWEKATIGAIIGNEISFTRQLLNTYQLSGKIQMISLPVYADATVSSTLTGNSWNGTSGGVIALQVTGTLLLNSDIDASGIGSRGGANTQVCPNNCGAFTNENAYYYPIGDYRGAYKGEGIAAVITNKELGRGAQTNGGGGGNDHNNGGGGAGNNALGGLGGNNAEPGFFNCKGSNNYGRSGNTLDYSALNRLFLGGGGGAGHGNNGSTGGCPNNGESGTGGNGGGIVIIIAGTINGNGHTINASGSAGGLGTGDGGGGGGAGGAIFLSVGIYTNSLTLDLRGGAGGNTFADGANRCFGPGGGGGAGITISSAALPGNVTNLFTGGSPGIITGSANACNGTSTTATAGGNTSAALTGASIPQGTVMPSAGCGLPVLFMYFKGKVKDHAVLLRWATASENNADHFLVERSADLVAFRSVGNIAAAGNTSWQTNYSFTDPSPLPGKNYYRLREVDWDGNYQFAPIIAVDLYQDELIKRIYPNPVASGTELYIEFYEPARQSMISLTDMSGRVIMQWTEKAANSPVKKIQVPEKLGGLYLLKINTGEKLATVKLAIQ